LIGIGTPVSVTAGRATFGYGLLGCGSLLFGEVGGHRIEGAGLVVQPVNPVEVVIGDFDRRQLALADRGGKLEHGQVMYLRHATEQ
jgi:hypothetical protein